MYDSGAYIIKLQQNTNNAKNIIMDITQTITRKKRKEYENFLKTCNKLTRKKSVLSFTDI
mgnify:CR=1 FL=1